VAVDPTGRWTKFRALSRDHRADFLSALALLPLVGAALRLFEFRTCQFALERLSKRRQPARESWRDAMNLAEIVRAAVRNGVTRPNCLRQALVLWYLLRRRGIAVDLKIGVRKTSSGALEAHAWVESGGRAVSDPGDAGPGFTPFREAIGDA